MPLTPQQHQQAKVLFQKVLKVPKSQRDEFLVNQIAEDPAVLREVETLLRYHEGNYSLRHQYKPIQIAHEPSPAGKAKKILRMLVEPARTRFALIAAILLIALFAIYLVQEHLRNTLTAEISSHLTSVLNSNYVAINLWTQRVFDDVSRWTNDPQVVILVQELIEIAKNSDHPADALTQASAQHQLAAILNPSKKIVHYQHFMLLSPSLMVLSSDLHQLIGKRNVFREDVAIGMGRMLYGQNFFLPRHLAARSFNIAEQSHHFSWFGVGILDAKAKPIAGLMFAVDALKNFDRILKVGRWGQSAETYAFDASGRMLSESRFTRGLLWSGLLPPGHDTLMGLQLKDPGGNLEKGFKPQEPLDELPLTSAINQALNGARSHDPKHLSGTILKPYRDYRGVEVIGAWRWNPNFDFAIITEIDAGEALALIRTIDRLFLGLAGALLITLTGLVYTSIIIFRVQPQARLGARMGQYKLLRKIGEGGVGEIYLARHELLKRPTAVKILRHEVTDLDTLRRFEVEVRETSRLSHPNTVAIYDFGKTVDGSFYYAMEILNGINLAKIIELDPLPAARAIHLLLQITGSLNEAHQMGLIHRDIKPQNIMVCCLGGLYDVIKVLDFGLVKNIKPLFISQEDHKFSKKILGTPAYLAPELILDSDAASAQSDIYALGVVAYKMLSGKRLFSSINETMLLYDILNTPPRPLLELRRDVPPKLAAIIMLCIEKNPELRPTSVAELTRLLIPLSQEFPWSKDDAAQWWDLHEDLMPSFIL